MRPETYTCLKERERRLGLDCIQFILFGSVRHVLCISYSSSSVSGSESVNASEKGKERKRTDALNEFV